MAEFKSRRFHLILDAHQCDPIVLTDAAYIENTVREIADLVDMKILFGPQSMEGVPANPGITCFTIVDFSHISIHTFVPANELCIDIFSCKPFDYEKLQQYVKTKFKLQDDNIHTAIVKYDPKELTTSRIS